jgi:hypothetical protein
MGYPLPAEMLTTGKNMSYKTGLSAALAEDEVPSERNWTRDV